MNNHVKPVTALAWSTTCLLAVGTLHTIAQLAAFGLLYGGILCVYTKTFRPGISAFKFSLPFVFPLVAVHGILNPAFDKSQDLFQVIPLRPLGALFAALISLRLFVLCLFIVTWQQVDRHRLICDAIKYHLPLGAIVTLASATATLHALNQRIRAVYLAQQARGMPAGPHLSARVRALPKVIIPVVASTLVEGYARGTALANRGLGLFSVRNPRHDPPASTQDYFVSLIPLAGYILVLFQS